MRVFGQSGRGAGGGGGRGEGGGGGGEGGGGTWASFTSASCGRSALYRRRSSTCIRHTGQERFTRVRNESGTVRNESGRQCPRQPNPTNNLLGSIAREVQQGSSRHWVQQGSDVIALIALIALTDRVRR